MRIFILTLLFFIFVSASAWAQPRVMVSIKPVHALVAGVLGGIAEPELLLSGGESPHSYALRPSQARALAAAHLVIWVGPDLETFLERPLKSLSGQARVIRLDQAQELELLPVRSGGVWDRHEHGHNHDHQEKTAHKHHPDGGSDPHLWLSPVNARAIVSLTLDALNALYPEHRETLRANAQDLLARLEALDDEVAQTLAPVREVPFVVFHDAYQYLEHSYGLNAVGSVSLDPERTPGAQRVREVQRLIRERGARCVFAEPQFTPRLLAIVMEGSEARQGLLDPLGAELPAGPDAYFTLMRNLAGNLRACLEP